MLALIVNGIRALNLRKGRKGSVLVEYIVLVSVVALSAAVIAAVTGFGTNVGSEYDEMSAAVTAL